LLEAVNAARARLARLPAILKRFRQSVLAAACSGQLTAQWREQHGTEHPCEDAELPASWARLPLRDLCPGFEYGSSRKSDDEGDVPVLRMGNVQDGRIDWSELKYSSDRAEIAKYTLAPNTVLFNRTNSPELVGKTAIYRGERPAIFAGYLIPDSPRPPTKPGILKLLPEYPGLPRVLHPG
jgi:type I restriction enzyme S subunit